MVTKKKVNLAEVLKHLNTTCTECGYSISPAEIIRPTWETVRCPKCGAVFTPNRSSKKM